MKKLLCLGFTALMMLFAVPNVWAEGEGETGGETTTPQPALYFVNLMQQPIQTGASIGRYYTPIAIVFGTEMSLGEEGVMVNAAENVVIYYTIDGTTEPTRAAYEAQTDKENGAIRMIDFSNEDVDPSVPTFTEAENLVIKAIAYVSNETETETETESEEEGTGATETTYTKEGTFTFVEVAAPTVDVAAGQVVAGTKVHITNVPTGAQSGIVFYTTDGRTLLHMMLDDDATYYDADEGIEITGEVGAQITLKAISYMSPSGNSMDQAGSKMTTVVYTIKTAEQPEEPAVTFTFNPADGATVAANAEITVTASKNGTAVDLTSTDNTLFYKWFATKAEAEEASESYTTWTPYANAKPQATVALPVLAVALEEVDNEADDAIVSYGYAEYTVTAAPEPTAITFTFDPVSGTAVEDGSHVTITASDNTVDIWYMYFESEEAARAAEWNFTDPDDVSDDAAWLAFKYSETNKPLITTGQTALKVTWTKGAEGNEEVGEDYGYAAYTLQEASDPTLTVKAVGGVTRNDSLIFADGKVAFDIFVEGIPAGDTTYRLYVSMTTEENPFPEPDILMPADSLRFENDYFNDSYIAVIELMQYNKMLGKYTEVTTEEIPFYVTEGETRPELTVKAVGNTMKQDSIIFADGKVAFDMFVEGVTVEAGDDTTYKLYITIAAEGEFPMPDVVDFADSVRYENIYDYNGTYEASFELVKLNKRGGYMTVADQKITFYVTELVDRPELTVKTVGNTTNEDNEIIFADGKVAFDLLTKNVKVEAGDDSTYKFYITIAAEGEFPMPDVIDFADSLRHETILDYNGTYEAAFELVRLIRGEYQTVADQKITFLVTEGMERPELEVKPVNNTTEEGKVIFADGKAAFDVLTKGIKVEAGDDSTYKIYVTIWNTEDDNDFPEPVVLNYADSVRYVAEAAYTNGTYEAAFELMKRDDRGDYTNVADATITFYVTENENVAVEAAELAGVNVYPNPSNGTFNVAVPEKARIDIFGLNGAKVMSREANAGVESFSINHSGIYFVRVMAGNKAAVKRVVVR